MIEVYGTNKCKDGTTFPVHVRFSKLDGELAIANVRDITEQKRAEETQNRLAEENSVMADIGKVISSSLDINDVYELLGAQIKKLIPFDRLVLTIIDRESSASIPTWIIGADVPGRDSGTPIPLAGSVAGEILRTRSASLLNGGLDSDLSERFPGLLPSLEAGLKSFVSTPLIYRDEIIGVLQLRALEMGVYSQQHLELAERIANQIAGAVANALLFAECRRLAEENAVMAEIGKVICSSLDINTVYDRLGEETQRLIQFDRMSLSLYEADARAMSITYVTGTDVPGRQSGAVIPLEGTIGGEVVRTMAPILVTKNENEDIVDRFPGVKPHSISGGDCFIAVPLVFQERLIGIYHLISRENAIYTHRHLDIATRIGNQIAGAVANAQMYENLEDTASELAVGDRIADIMTSTADDGELYKKFSDEIGRLVAFDRITINRIDTYTQSFTPIYIGGIQVPERRVGMTLPLEGTITQYVLDSGQTILDENIRDGSRITADRSHIKGRFRSSISVPLRS